MLDNIYKVSIYLFLVKFIKKYKIKGFFKGKIYEWFLKTFYFNLMDFSDSILEVILVLDFLIF